MVYFVITGKKNCPNYIHAIHVAAHLRKQLLHFHFRGVVKEDSEWPSWLDQLNSTNNWHETKSPVIWKELSKMGGKAYLIGGLGEFWEYCYDYYGFVSNLDKEDIEKIIADNLFISSYATEIKINNISIFGAANYIMLQFVIYELQHCFPSRSNETVEVKLYDEIISNNTDEEAILLRMVESLREAVKCNPQSISVTPSIQEALNNCDLLLIINNYSRRSGEDIDSWLERCRNDMLILSDDINHHAKSNLRIILSHSGPVCFNASVLMEYCTRIKLSNIVAVTADEGISVINILAEKTHQPVENFWCPPVLGFSGLYSYLPIGSTCITAKVVRPFKRALKMKETSHLPKGFIQHEVRLVETSIYVDDDLYTEIENKKIAEMNVLKRQPVLPKVRALGSLLKLWFAEEISDDIISLGICSNGYFGIPPGICFSQAVILNKNRKWEPFTNLPLQCIINTKISAILVQVEGTLKKFGLGERTSLSNISSTMS